MPSSLHEVLVDLFVTRPALALELARAAGVAVPAGATVVAASDTVRELQPTELHVDFAARVELNGRTLLGVLVEIQLTAPREEKRASWLVYVAWGRRTLRAPCVLLVVAPDPAVAAVCAEPIETGHPGFVLCPIGIGAETVPRIVDPAEARGEPALAVLSALVHAREAGAEHIALAALDACRALDEDRAHIYADVVKRALPAAARRALEDLMLHGYEYQDEFAKRYFAEGKAEGEAKGEAKGKAEGEAKAIVTVLRARGIAVGEDAERRIFACTELARLDEWTRRAVSVASVEELLGGG